MPQDKKRRVHQLRSSDDIKNEQECFKIRFTGELFTDYDQYIDALFAYQARQWTCALSGKGKLTYEEAQLSERHQQRKVDDAFPEMFIEPLCRMVHMSQMRMDELTEGAYARLQCFINGEDVEHVQEGGAVRAVRVVKPLDVDEDFWQEIDFEAPPPSKYVVEVLDYEEPAKAEGEEAEAEAGEAETGEADGGRFVEVAGKELRRYKGRSVSRITIKSKLKTVGSRQGYWQAPFLCETELVQRFGLRTELPPHIQRLKLQYEVRTGRLDKEVLVGLDPDLVKEAKRRRKKADEADPGRAALKQLKTTAQKKVWQSAMKDKDPDTPVQEVAAALYEAWNGGDCVALAAEAGLPPEQYMEETRKVLSALLAAWPSDLKSTPLLPTPIEDRLLPPDPSLQERPELLSSLFVPETDLFLPAECLGQVLMAWDFAQRFGRIVKLSPFSLEDLVGALVSSSDSPVLSESFHALLAHLLAHHETDGAALYPYVPEDALLPPPPAAAPEGEDAQGDTGEEEPEAEVMAVPSLAMLEERRFTEVLAQYITASRSPPPLYLELPPLAPPLSKGTTEAMQAAAGAGAGLWTLGVHARVELLAALCDDAAATPSIHRHLDQAFEETRDLQKEMRQEDLKMKEEKKNAKLEKQQTKERIKQEILSQMSEKEVEKAEAAEPEVAEEVKAEGKAAEEGGKEGMRGKRGLSQKEKKKLEEEEKKRVKQVEAATKAALAKQREEQARRLEQERQNRANLQKNYEAEMEKHVVRVEALGEDRDKREYWMLTSKDYRLFVHQPRKHSPLAAPAKPGGGDVKMEEAEGERPEATASDAEKAGEGEGDVKMEEGAEGGGGGERREGQGEEWDGESWGFYERTDQIDALLAFLNPNGVREGALYEQLSIKYMKITGNMRRKQQELSKAEAVLHAEVRRSVRIKTDVVTKQLPFMAYRNLYKEAPKPKK